MSEYLSIHPLRDEFITNDEDYRYAYAEDFLNTSIATQIKVLRDQRGMTQKELAEAIGTKQSGVSRLESVHYSNWKTDTLKKIARAFKVRLKITFETFGTLLDEDANFSRDALQRPSFEDDPVFKDDTAEAEGEEVEAAAVEDATPARQFRLVETAAATGPVQGTLAFHTLRIASGSGETTHVKQVAPVEAAQSSSAKLILKDRVAS